MVSKIINPLLISIILFGLICPVSDSEDLRDCTASSLILYELQEMADDSKLTNPALLNQFENEKDVLAVYGTIPITKTSKEAYEWWLKIESVAEALAQDDELYQIFDDNIVGIQANADGILILKILVDYEKNVTTEDLEAAKRIVDKQADMQNIKNIPLVIKTDSIAMGFESETISSGSDSATVRATNPTGYVLHPIGGIKMSTNTGSGTIGYAAKYANNSNMKGIVTVAHLLRFENKTVYQPSVSVLSSIGHYSLMNESYDCVFFRKVLLGR